MGLGLISFIFLICLLYVVYLLSVNWGELGGKVTNCCGAAVGQAIGRCDW